MYKMLIVDDERIEREGMVQLIEWEKYGIQIIGSAWNGIEGIELIKEYRPDIVLTDIRMPGMNGISMIQKAQEIYSEITYIVLSGYGEYEYTSQAMELGVKHYILKPCDEEKLIKVINKVKEEIHSKEKLQNRMEYLLPNAMEQFFRRVLEEESVFHKDYKFYQNYFGLQKKELRLLTIKFDKEVKHLNKFALKNIFNELLTKEQLVLQTDIDHALWMLIEMDDMNQLRTLVRKASTYYAKLDNELFDAVVSKSDNFLEISKQKRQVEELFVVKELFPEEILLTGEQGLGKWQQESWLSGIDKWRKISSFEDLLLEITILYAKIELSKASLKQKQIQLSYIMQKISENYKVEITEIMLQNRVEFFEGVLDILEKTYTFSEDIDPKIKDIIKEIYLYLDRQELSIYWLAKEVLFVNEGYLGRYFSKYMTHKMSTYIQEIRMKVVGILLHYEVDIGIEDLTRLVGFPEDGQYFSRIFKKHHKITLTQYRKQVREMPGCDE